MARAMVEKESNFDRIIEFGKEKGHLTYDEINERLPEKISPEDMNELFVVLESLNIGVSDESSDRDSPVEDKPLDWVIPGMSEG